MKGRGGACLAGLALGAVVVPGCLEISGFQKFRLDEAGEGSCADGLDGEGDGLLDCGDPECASRWRCVPSAPEGWDGPFVVELASGLWFEACSDSATVTQFLFEGPGLAACSACSCGTLSCPFDFECGPAGSNCANGLTSLPVSMGCQEMPASAAVCRWSAGVPTSCDAVGGELYGNTVNTTLLFCAHSVGAGCGAGEACSTVSAPPAGTMAARRSCITQVGEQPTCPSSYPERRIAYKDYEDKRECTPCMCKFAEPPVCSDGALLVTQGADCSGALEALVEDECTPVTWAAYAAVPAELTEGTCDSPTGGEPQGEVVLDSTVTVCCRPEGS